MGLIRKQQHNVAAYLSLVLMVMILLKAPKFASGYDRFNKFRTGSSSLFDEAHDHHGKRHHRHHQQPQHKQQEGHNHGVLINSSSFKGRNNSEDPQNGDQIFEDDKRKVHTGPNPLHNR